MKLATHNHPFGNTSLINWFFDDVLTKDTFNDNGNSHSVLSALNKPGMNIIEDKDNFNIELATPGLDKDDFKIDLKNGMIHVSAQKKTEKTEDKKNYKSREFNFSSFKRSFKLPQDVDAEKISAEYINGILNLTIPKLETAKNGIQVKVK